MKKFFLITLISIVLLSCEKKEDININVHNTILNMGLIDFNENFSLYKFEYEKLPLEFVSGNKSLTLGDSVYVVPFDGYYKLDIEIVSSAELTDKSCDEIYTYASVLFFFGDYRLKRGLSITYPCDILTIKKPVDSTFDSTYRKKGEKIGINFYVNKKDGTFGYPLNVNLYIKKIFISIKYNEDKN